MTSARIVGVQAGNRTDRLRSANPNLHTFAEAKCHERPVADFSDVIIGHIYTHACRKVAYTAGNSNTITVKLIAIDRNLKISYDIRG